MANVNLRNRRLPQAYLELEYLQSTGKQWIDTGITPNNTTEVLYTCAVIGDISGVDSHLFGSRLTASSQAFDLAYMNQVALSKTIRFIHGTTTSDAQTSLVTPTTIKNKLSYYMSGTNVKVNGTQIMSFTTATYTGTYDLWLFGVNNAGTLHDQVRSQKLYGCQIWDNGVLVRDFIPAVHKVNGTAGMYDMVTDTLYIDENGEEEFIQGPVIKTADTIVIGGKDVKQLSMPYVGNKYEFYDYVESNQAGWIDTGIKYHSTMSLEGKYERLGQGIAGSTLLFSTSTSYPCLFFTALSSTIYDRTVFRRGGYAEQSYNHPISMPFTSTIRLDYDSDSLTIDGTVVKTGMISAIGGKTDPYYSVSNMFLFGIANTYQGYGRIYYAKVWDNNILVRDFIPAKRLSDNAIGMYDSVEDKFYANAGTGTFTPGNIIHPQIPVWTKTSDVPTNTYTRKNYLQSSGTQYMYTGYMAQANKEYTYVLDFDASDIINDTTLFGARISGANRSPLLYYSNIQGAENCHFHFNYAGYNAMASPTKNILCPELGRHTVELYINELTHKSGVKVDGTSVYSNINWSGTAYSGYVTALFCDNASGTAIENSSYKMYGFKIYDGTNLIRNMVPVIRNSDNKPGMYDTVEDNFYTNQATSGDDFTTG